MVDYSNEGFTMPIEKDGVRGYASVHTILYREEDGLDVTGNYFVYLLHPVMGSTHFTLERSGNDEKPWEKTGGVLWVKDEIVQEIIDEIEMKRVRVELNL